MFESGLLKGKKFLVTGGGTGLGKAMARRFSELGAGIVICGRRLEVLEATAREISGETGGSVAVRQIDIRDAEGVEAMVESIWAEGPLDGLVNNAAGNFISKTEELSHRAVDAVLAGQPLPDHQIQTRPLTGWRTAGKDHLIGLMQLHRLEDRLRTPPDTDD